MKNFSPVTGNDASPHSLSVSSPAEIMNMARRERTKMLVSHGDSIVIFRENPLFDYFSEDGRAEGVLITDNGISLIGEKEVDEEFVPLDRSDVCSIPPFYEFRNARRCSEEINGIFGFMLRYESEVIKSKKMEIYKAITPLLSSITGADSEISLANSVMDATCSKGIQLFYNPIVAFDSNTTKIWNRPGNGTSKKVMYLEIASRSNGMTALFSETFLTSDSEKGEEGYRSILAGIDAIKRLFVDGGRTSDVSRELMDYRNEKLYLTTPLFPFSYHMIPGPDEKIRIGDVAVFDLWTNAGEFRIRKKVTAVAGSYAAEVF